MTKKINKGVELLILLLILFSLIGCSTGDVGLIASSPDEIAIKAIADNVKTAIENKDVEMFMNNISLDYSDSKGRTYDSIYIMAQSMVDEIENAEDMADSYGAYLIVNTSTANLIINESSANSDFTITVKAKFSFITVYNYSMDFEVIYQKEESDWKVISMLEKS